MTTEDSVSLSTYTSGSSSTRISGMPASVEMALSSSFGKEIANVRLIDAKLRRTDKSTLVGKEETRTFLMDAGF